MSYFINFALGVRGAIQLGTVDGIATEAGAVAKAIELAAEPGMLSVDAEDPEGKLVYTWAIEVPAGTMVSVPVWA